LLDKLAGNLPKSLPWRQRTVEQFKAEKDGLLEGVRRALVQK
jgi:hypothetical protein